MSAPKISILTPTFNAARFLKSALESVRSQEYPDYEQIIADNCSVDGTLEIARSYPNTVVSSEPDEGMSDALNRAITLSSGQIIGWLNADDVYQPGTFEKVRKLFEDPAVDAVYSNLIWADSEFREIRRIYHHPPVPWLSVITLHVPSQTFFCRRKIFDAGHRFDLRYRLAMDKDLFARLLLSGYNFRYVDDFFATFRLHGENLSLPSGRPPRRHYDEAILLLRERTGLPFPSGELGRILFSGLYGLARIYRLIRKLPHARKRGSI